MDGIPAALLGLCLWMAISSSGAATGSKVYRLYSEEVSYDTASANCAALGGGSRLAMPKSEQNFYGIMSDIMEQGDDLLGKFWIGLDDQDDDKTFTWADGSPLTYTRWGSDQPNSHGDGPFCVGIEPSKNWSWDDVPCAKGYFYICESDKTQELAELRELIEEQNARQSAYIHTLEKKLQDEDTRLNGEINKRLSGDIQQGYAVCLPGAGYNVDVQQVSFPHSFSKVPRVFIALGSIYGNGASSSDDHTGSEFYIGANSITESGFTLHCVVYRHSYIQKMKVMWIALPQ